MGFSSLIFAATLAVLAVAAAAPTTEQRVESGDILDRAARSGDLTLLETDDRTSARIRQIREVEVNGCYVAFKTATDGANFRASIVHFGKGSSIRVDQQHDRIRISSALVNADVTIVHSKASNAVIAQALRQVQDACQAENVIF